MSNLSNRRRVLMGNSSIIAPVLKTSLGGFEVQSQASSVEISIPGITEWAYIGVFVDDVQDYVLTENNGMILKFCAYNPQVIYAIGSANIARVNGVVNISNGTPYLEYYSNPPITLGTDKITLGSKSGTYRPNVPYRYMILYV